MMLAIVFLAVEVLATTVATVAPCNPRPVESCPQRSLSITVHNTLRLFIDGVESTNLPNANDWKKADTVSLPCYARVIAVLATDDGAERAGILASTNDGIVKTDDSWKCTGVYQRNWETVGFDDSSWPSAREIAVHRTYACPLMKIEGIRKDSYWIWTDNFFKDNTRDRVVYCRRKFALPPGPTPCPRRWLSITVDSKLRLYFDGIEQTGLPNAKNWTQADNVKLPRKIQVIAVKGTNDGGSISGILASTGDGYILTNGSWKCTNELHVGWENATYDDSTWPAARAIGIHQAHRCPWIKIQNIRLDAYWIWTEKYERNAGGDAIVYCRLKIDKEEEEEEE